MARQPPLHSGSSESTLLDPAAMSKLSVREEQVLRLAAAGLLDKQIGPQMGVSLNTLRSYWKRIRSKVGEGSRSALAVAYIEQASLNFVGDAAEPDWEIDLSTRTWRKLSDRKLPLELPPGAEIPLDELLSSFHPEDEPRIRDLFEGIKTNDATSVNYIARMLTPQGQQLAHGNMRVIRDVNGEAVKLIGRRTPAFNFRANDPVFDEPELHEGWTYQPDTGRLLASDKINQRHDLRSGVDYPWQAYAKLFEPESFEKGTEALNEVADGKIKTSVFRLKLLDPKARHELLVTIHGIHDADDRVKRVVGYETWVPKVTDEEEPPRMPIEIGFWAKDLRKGEFLLPDADFCKIYRVDPNSPTLDADIRSRYAPEDLNAAYDFIDKAVAEGKTRGWEAFKLHFEDGSEKWIRLEYRIESDEIGPIRATGTVLSFQ